MYIILLVALPQCLPLGRDEGSFPVAADDPAGVSDCSLKSYGYLR